MTTNESLAAAVTGHEVRPGAYYDSVVLMQLQRALAGLPGVIDAGVVMATPANCELLAASGLLPGEATAAGADDLLIVVKAKSDTAVAEALAQVDTLVTRRRTAVGQAFRPRSLETAVKALPEASWTLISVPGRYAAAVGQMALDFNHHLFLYSDNVALEDEIALKTKARSKGLLVMGPDCGTAIVNGIGLGFANRVRRGAIGVVGASGTGLQAITTHIHQLGGGVSQAIGCGGRDLSLEVGAITAHQGLDLLARDSETEVIVIVSKPPAPEVATRLLAAAQATGKPVVINFMGYPAPARRLGNLHFAATLSEGAELAVKLQSAEQVAVAEIKPLSGYLRGLFSGGTLAYEALLGLQTVLLPIYSNAPVRPSQRLADSLRSQAHTILDLGADEFTQGRLHPMMDNDLRLRRLRQEAADPEVALIFLDVVLGEGAHPDPAAELAPAIAEVHETAVAQGRSLDIVALVIGTDEDPQEVHVQMEKLAEAGAIIFRDTTEAVTYAAQRLNRYEPDSSPIVAPESLKGTLTAVNSLAAINVGLESFYESIKSQGAQAIHVEWRPPAGGNEKLMDLLARMKSRQSPTS